jgi:hypothetical protein
MNIEYSTEETFQLLGVSDVALMQVAFRPWFGLQFGVGLQKASE